ncbi:MAG: GIY-YIG nuclease family protein [Candidatus Aenigmarchaeota archaeon]|nr:GIY-YIG nuclease family protein [Candidatus Aenigmarchaeota archaeon]
MRGSYILFIKLENNSKIRIGKLGIIDFPRGYYCYVGSALGKTVNLEKRINRHKRLDRDKSGKLRWHIDYFLVNPNSSIIDIITIKSNKRMECETSEKLERVADKSINGFGCSDCDCKSHFHYFKNKQDCGKIFKKIRK